MKVLISQPRTGTPDFGKIKQQLNKLHIDVVDNVWEDNDLKTEGLHYNNPLYYLSRTIYSISKVDAVCFGKGWEKYTQCVIERTICEAYGVKILEWSWLEDVKPCDIAISKTNDNLLITKKDNKSSIVA